MVQKAEVVKKQQDFIEAMLSFSGVESNKALQSVVEPLTSKVGVLENKVKTLENQIKNETDKNVVLTNNLKSIEKIIAENKQNSSSRLFKIEEVLKAIGSLCSVKIKPVPIKNGE